MKIMTILDEIADRFIEDILGEYPIMMYSLDYELKEYLPTVKEHKYRDSLKQIVIENRRATNELTDAFLKTNELQEYMDDEKLLNEMKREYFQYISASGRPLLAKLIQLVMNSAKVRVRIMHELQEMEQDDDYMPNVWISHRNWKSKDVMDYVIKVYDSTRQEDEIEEEDDMR
jgi:hypothetical protein